MFFLCAKQFYIYGVIYIILTALAKVYKQIYPDRVLLDCKHLFDIGYRIDGIYTINPDGNSQINVFCELSLSNVDGAGWTVIQRRIDASLDFYR